MNNDNINQTNPDQEGGKDVVNKMHPIVEADIKKVVRSTLITERGEIQESVVDMNNDNMTAMEFLSAWQKVQGWIELAVDSEVDQKTMQSVSFGGNRPISFNDHHMLYRGTINANRRPGSRMKTVPFETDGPGHDLFNIFLNLNPALISNLFSTPLNVLPDGTLPIEGYIDPINHTFVVNPSNTDTRYVNTGDRRGAFDYIPYSLTNLFSSSSNYMPNNGLFDQGIVTPQVSVGRKENGSYVFRVARMNRIGHNLAENIVNPYGDYRTLNGSKDITVEGLLERDTQQKRNSEHNEQAATNDWTYLSYFANQGVGQKGKKEDDYGTWFHIVEFHLMPRTGAKKGWVLKPVIYSTWTSGYDKYLNPAHMFHEHYMNILTACDRAGYKVRHRKTTSHPFIMKFDKRVFFTETEHGLRHVVATVNKGKTTAHWGKDLVTFAPYRRLASSFAIMWDCVIAVLESKYEPKDIIPLTRNIPQFRIANGALKSMHTVAERESHKSVRNPHGFSPRDYWYAGKAKNFVGVLNKALNISGETKAVVTKNAFGGQASIKYWEQVQVAIMLARMFRAYGPAFLDKLGVDWMIFAQEGVLDIEFINLNTDMPVGEEALVRSNNTSMIQHKERSFDKFFKLFGAKARYEKEILEAFGPAGAIEESVMMSQSLDRKDKIEALLGHVCDAVRAYGQIPTELRQVRKEIREHVKNSRYNIKDVHDYVVRESARYQEDNKALYNTKVINSWHEKEIAPGITVVVPKYTHELVAWGTSQNNCISAYATGAGKREYFIIGFRNSDGDWIGHARFAVDHANHSEWGSIPGAFANGEVFVALQEFNGKSFDEVIPERHFIQQWIIRDMYDVEATKNEMILPDMTWAEPTFADQKEILGRVGVHIINNEGEEQ